MTTKSECGLGSRWLRGSGDEVIRIEIKEVEAKM